MLWALRLIGFLYPAVAAACLTLLGVMLVHQPVETRSGRSLKEELQAQRAQFLIRHGGDNA